MPVKFRGDVALVLQGEESSSKQVVAIEGRARKRKAKEGDIPFSLGITQKLPISLPFTSH